MSDTRPASNRRTLHADNTQGRMSDVPPEPAPIGTCIYCGFPTRGVACIAHTDLPRQDPQIGGMTVKRTVVESWFGR